MTRRGRGPSASERGTINLSLGRDLRRSVLAAAHASGLAVSSFVRNILEETLNSLTDKEAVE